MNGYKVISALALLILVVGIPVYSFREPDRMAQAQVSLRQEFVAEAAALYVENCALCHGAAGEGIGATPALDNPALRTADYETLFKTIARGRYGTAMAGWHSGEGGVFNDYQIDQFVALIRYVDWPLVGELAANQGLIPPTLPVPEVEESFLAEVAALNPEGETWAEGMQVYASNCTVCHGVNGEGSDMGLPLNTEEIRAREAVDLARTITEGVPGTAMVAWKNVLSVDDIEALVAFLGNWDVIEGQGLLLEPPEPLHIDLDNPEEVLALGERLYSTTCVSCHGDNGVGGTGPALNSLQVLTNRTDDQIKSTIVNGGFRPSSTMPSFGDRLTIVEIEALVNYIRAWEPTATWVENPRGSQQGGGPPWLRATPDANSPTSPRGTTGSGARGGGPPWRQNTSTTPTETTPIVQGPALSFSGVVVSVSGNLLTFQTSDGASVDASLGPPWFWSTSGIPLAPGDQVQLEGIEASGHLETNWLTNLTSGQTIRLRDENGQPVWSNGATGVANP